MCEIGGTAVYGNVTYLLHTAKEIGLGAMTLPDECPILTETVGVEDYDDLRSGMTS